MSDETDSGRYFGEQQEKHSRLSRGNFSDRMYDVELGLEKIHVSFNSHKEHVNSKLDEIVDLLGVHNKTISQMNCIVNGGRFACKFLTISISVLWAAYFLLNL
jgi:hypothetical protein